MIKIDDSKKMQDYISKHGIDKIFNKDMKSFMELMFFKKNEYIWRQGEASKCLYFFIQGKAKVYTTLSNGKSLLLCFYPEVKVFGDLELMSGQTAAASVQAIEDTYCIIISLEKVQDYLFNDVKFLRFIGNSLSEKLNQSSKNSSINLLYPLENRLASYILETSQIITNNEASVLVFNENLTEIAELLGTSYRHLLRTLNSLCQKNIIIKRNNYFEIMDKQSLKKLAADVYQ